MRYLAVYVRGTNAIFRCLWEKCKKYHISPLTTEVQEMRYPAVYDKKYEE